MVMFWVALLAISILLYVLLDGVDLGVGLLFGLSKGEASRGTMLSAVAPIRVDQAAAPRSSLVFMFWGCGVFVFPLMLIYTVVSYTVFRGKVRTTDGYGH
jgi:cytochrome bd-type quinol oxidase subunit 2